jgi:hypothetical protein
MGEYGQEKIELGGTKGVNFIYQEIYKQKLCHFISMDAQ